jgi:hypothetical protein
MSEAPVPYSLKPKATKLAEGPDPSLKPTFSPVDPAVRGVPPTFWPQCDTSKGGTGPGDPPPPPGVDSTRRTTPTFAWPRPPITPNRSLAELVEPETLDPDIALWPVIPVQVWPFTGPPTTGRWPPGWVGIDNKQVMWVCTAYPDTFAILAHVGGGGGSGWPTINGTGAGNLDAETAPSDTVGYTLIDRGSGGVNLNERGTGGISVTDTGSGGISILEKGTGGLTLEADSTSATQGIQITTGATDLGGINLTNNGVGDPYGVDILDNGSTDGIQIVSQATAGGLVIQSQGSGAIGINTFTSPIAISAGSTVSIFAGGSTGDNITLHASNAQIILQGLPTSDPGIAGALWNSGGVVHIH